MTPLLRRLVARIDQRSRRDRLALAGGLLAGAIGLEALVVLPLHDKRQRIEQSLHYEAAQQASAHATHQAEQHRRLAGLRAAAAVQQSELAALGLKTAQHDSLSAFLTQGLLSQGVVLTALKGLPVEPLPMPAEAGAAGGTTAMATAEAAPAADGTPAPPADPAAAAAPATLYRHRAEITLQGAVPNLTRALVLLEHGLAPLRLERVHLAPARPDGSPVQATVVLTTISPERTWLAL